MVIFFKAEDVANSKTKYIPAAMCDRREDVSSMTLIYTVKVQTINDFGVSEWSNMHKFSTTPGILQIFF